MIKCLDQMPNLDNKVPILAAWWASAEESANCVLQLSPGSPGPVKLLLEISAVQVPPAADQIVVPAHNFIYANEIMDDP